MKINFKAIILSLIASISAYAQEISAELPVLSPQTPTTNDLGKYGEVQVNESSGIISPSIPLFTYEAGGFELPLTLNYSGNGVKVNQDPTWAGINWNINPGGVITRVVNDLPDELTLTQDRIYFSEQELDAKLGVRQTEDGLNLDKNTEWYIFIDNLTRAQVDSEIDIFNYNFLGYSGSFYLDTNNNVHFIKYDKELKINFHFVQGNKSYFIIQTLNGDTYYFGGQNASESSRTWVNNGSGSTVNIPFAQNSFYLYNVILYNGTIVNFNYETVNRSCDFYNIGIVEAASVALPLGNFPCNKSKKDLINQMENIVHLKEITNNLTNEKVEFNYSYLGKCNRLIKLNSITFSNNNQQLKKINLLFLNSNNEPDQESNEFKDDDKFFLQKVEFYGESNTFLYDYQLTYITPELFPSKNSFAQDDLGYYNGKISNTTLLPKTNNNLLNENCFFGLADREADYISSLIGSLESIQYPTKGKMEFEYELPYKGQQDIITKHYVNVYYRDENRNNTSLLSKVYYPNNLQPIVFTTAKTINIGLNIMARGSFSHQNNVKIEVYKKVGTSWIVQETKQKYITNTENTEINYEEYYSLDLPAGSYYFKVSLELVATGVENSVVANATLYLPQGTRPVFYPGLRIKRVKTLDNNNTNVTRYYYNELGNINLESFVFDPKYVQIVPTLDTSSSLGVFVNVYKLNPNNVNNIYNTEMGSSTYKNVTISYGGDNFEKGGKELTFHKNSNSIPQIYSTHPNMAQNDIYTYGYYVVSGTQGQGSIGSYQGDGIGLVSLYERHLDFDYNTALNVGNNDSYQNSILKKERYFNDDKKILSEKIYNYEGVVTNVNNNIKITNLFNVPSAINSNITKNTYILYKGKSYDYKLLSTITKEYFGANLTDEVVTTTNYTYKPNKVSLPSEITTTNSASETSTTKLFYPSDVNEIQGLSSNEIQAINTLQQAYNIGQLVRTESYLNNTLLGAKQVSFAPFGSKIYPRKITSFKGNGENNLEDRLEFYSYFFGNPSLISQTDGTKVKYEYNNNMQVILKIENFLGSSISIDDDNPPSTNNSTNTLNVGPCYYQNLYPDCMVTSYEYDSVTNNLVKITDPKCNIITYHYDDFGRLQFVKDAQGNILSENNYNYKN